MAFINSTGKEINCKVVYYGPPRCGKTTTLQQIYKEAKSGASGEMISLSRSDDRTLFFDFVPLNLGKIKDYTVRVHLYTVPGQIGYEQSRSLISKGVDGMVFIADSQLEMMAQNIECLAELKKMLAKDGEDFKNIPVVFQLNKRDVKGALPIAQMNNFLNPDGAPYFETVATRGKGIMDAFRQIASIVLKKVSDEILKED